MEVRGVLPFLLLALAANGLEVEELGQAPTKGIEDAHNEQAHNKQAFIAGFLASSKKVLFGHKKLIRAASTKATAWDASTGVTVPFTPYAKNQWGYEVAKQTLPVAAQIFQAEQDDQHSGVKIKPASSQAWNDHLEAAGPGWADLNQNKTTAIFSVAIARLMKGEKKWVDPYGSYLLFGSRSGGSNWTISKCVDDPWTMKTAFAFGYGHSPSPCKDTAQSAICKKRKKKYNICSPAANFVSFVRQGARQCAATCGLCSYVKKFQTENGCLNQCQRMVTGGESGCSWRCPAWAAASSSCSTVNQFMQYDMCADVCYAEVLLSNTTRTINKAMSRSRTFTNPGGKVRELITVNRRVGLNGDGDPLVFGSAWGEVRVNAWDDMLKATICHTTKQAGIQSQKSNLRCQEKKVARVTKVCIYSFKSRSNYPALQEKAKEMGKGVAKIEVLGNGRKDHKWQLDQPICCEAAVGDSAHECSHEFQTIFKDRNFPLFASPSTWSVMVQDTIISF